MSTTTQAVAAKAGVDAYRFWRAALRNEKVDPLKTCHGDTFGDPQPGLWKMRDGSRAAPFVPVKIWLIDQATGEIAHRFEDGKRYTCAALRGKSDTPLSHDETVRVWSFCMSHPIAISDRDAWIKTGRFPGEVAAPVPPSAAVQAAAMLSSPAAQIGDNSKGTEADPLKLIKMEFDDYAATVREFIAKAERAGGIKTKPDADQAANMADMIGKNRGGIARRADDARKEANAPLQAEIDDNNACFGEVIEGGDKLARQLRTMAQAWVDAEEARLRAEAKQQAEAAAAAENKRRAEERERLAKENEERAAATNAALAGMAEQLGDDAGQIEPVEPEPVEIGPDLADVPVVVPEVRVHVGGQRGAKRGLKGKKVATVTDYAACLAYFAENDKVKELIAKLAQAAVTAGATVPGVTVTTERKL